MPTCYSPVRRCTHPRRGFLARLACVKHAASVRPEPGSNSPKRKLSIGFNLPVRPRPLVERSSTGWSAPEPRLDGPAGFGRVIPNDGPSSASPGWRAGTNPDGVRSSPGHRRVGPDAETPGKNPYGACCSVFKERDAGLGGHRPLHQNGLPREAACALARGRPAHCGRLLLGGGRG